MQHARALPGARFVDPAVLQRIDDLELIAKTVVDGLVSGLHRSRWLGLSLDFAEHRAYMPGDDIRRIDWRLYARTDRHYVKEFEADTNTSFTVLLDVSASMSYRGSGIAKLDYARMLAGSLAYFASRQRDRVGLVTFDDDIVDYVPPSAKHLEVLLHTLERSRPGGRGALVPPMRRIAELLQRRGIVVLISDFYEEPESVADAVSSLRSAGNDVIVFHLLDPTELTFPFDAAQSFQDLETGERVPVVPDALRERYREMVATHVSTLRTLLRSERIDYAMFDTSQPLEHALFALLSERARLQQAGRRNGGVA